MDTILEDMLQKAAFPVQEIVRAAMERLEKLIPEARLKVVPGYRSINYGYGPGMKDQFLALLLHSKHVNLQFFQGSELPDPENLLEGTGKRMRHVKLLDGETIQTEGIADLVRAADAAACEQRHQ